MIVGTLGRAESWIELLSLTCLSQDQQSISSSSQGYSDFTRMRKDEFIGSLPRICVEGEWKTNLSTPARDSNPKLSVVSSLVYHESDALDHTATEAVHLTFTGPTSSATKSTALPGQQKVVQRSSTSFVVGQVILTCSLTLSERFQCLPTIRTFPLKSSIIITASCYLFSLSLSGDTDMSLISTGAGMSYVNTGHVQHDIRLCKGIHHRRDVTLGNTPPNQVFIAAVHRSPSSTRTNFLRILLPDSAAVTSRHITSTGIFTSKALATRQLRQGQDRMVTRLCVTLVIVVVLVTTMARGTEPEPSSADTSLAQLRPDDRVDKAKEYCPVKFVSDKVKIQILAVCTRMYFPKIVFYYFSTKMQVWELQPEEGDGEESEPIYEEEPVTIPQGKRPRRRRRKRLHPRPLPQDVHSSLDYEDSTVLPPLRPKRPRVNDEDRQFSDEDRPYRTRPRRRRIKPRRRLPPHRLAEVSGSDHVTEYPALDEGRRHNQHRDEGNWRPEPLIEEVNEGGRRHRLRDPPFSQDDYSPRRPRGKKRKPQFFVEESGITEDTPEAQHVPFKHFANPPLPVQSEHVYPHKLDDQFHNNSPLSDQETPTHPKRYKNQFQDDSTQHQIQVNRQLPEVPKHYNIHYAEEFTIPDRYNPPHSNNFNDEFETAVLHPKPSDGNIQIPVQDSVQFPKHHPQFGEDILTPDNITPLYSKPFNDQFHETYNSKVENIYPSQKGKSHVSPQELITIISPIDIKPFAEVESQTHIGLRSEKIHTTEDRNLRNEPNRTFVASHVDESHKPGSLLIEEKTNTANNRLKFNPTMNTIPQGSSDQSLTTELNQQDVTTTTERINNFKPSKPRRLRLPPKTFSTEIPTSAETIISEYSNTSINAILDEHTPIPEKTQNLFSLHNIDIKKNHPRTKSITESTKSTQDDDKWENYPPPFIPQDYQHKLRKGEEKQGSSLNTVSPIKNITSTNEITFTNDAQSIDKNNIPINQMVPKSNYSYDKEKQNESLVNKSQTLNLPSRKRPNLPLNLQESPNLDPLNNLPDVEGTGSDQSLPYVHRELSKYAPRHRIVATKNYSLSVNEKQEYPTIPSVVLLPPVKIQYKVQSIEELILKTRESLQPKLELTTINSANGDKIKVKEVEDTPMRKVIPFEAAPLIPRLENRDNSKNETGKLPDTFTVQDEIVDLLNSESGSARLARILESRNMTLSELLEHRERGSSQQHLSEIFRKTSLHANISSMENVTNLIPNIAGAITSSEGTTILKSAQDILKGLTSIENIKLANHFLLPPEREPNVSKFGNKIFNSTVERNKVRTIDSSDTENSREDIQFFPTSNLTKLFRESARRSSRMFDHSKQSPHLEEHVTIIQKPAPYPIPIWKPTILPQPFGTSLKNSTSSNNFQASNLNITQVNLDDVDSKVFFETEGKVHQVQKTSKDTKHKKSIDISSLEDKDYESPSLNENNNYDDSEYVAGDDDLIFAGFTIPLKSAIIASSAILAVTLLVFLGILLTCRWRQKQARRRYVDGIVGARARSPILGEHMCSHMMERNKKDTKRSLTPVLVSARNFYNKHSTEEQPEHRRYYLWTTIRNTLKYK
uniref:Uncharacterized protein n=1 Tax=Timema bartmani TaxID=61472 RepID=A0A7R9EPG5_9NEOP|nr:unnamed protein product [Timema bartmani]